MRVDPNSQPAVTPEPLTPEPAATRLLCQAYRSAVPPDRISAPSRDADAIDSRGVTGKWAKDEWNTIAGAVHELASVPGVVSNAWLSAARTNEHLAARIEGMVSTWQQTAPSVRQTAIDALRAAAAPVSSSASALADELAQANRVPLLRAATGSPTNASSRTPLPADLESRARDAARTFTHVAAAQSAHASMWYHGASRALGASVVDLHAGLAHTAPEASALNRIPGLKDIPVAAFGLTVAGIAADIAAGVSPRDAEAANIAGLTAGTLVGAGVENALVRFGGAAVADTVAEGLGVAAATAAGGWALAAAALAGAAAGYGVSAALESPPGRAFIDGLGHSARALDAAVCG
jgi:hypothetical protein